MAVKRYELTSPTWCGGSVSADANEDADGDWVKYEDIVHLIEAARRAVPAQASAPEVDTPEFAKLLEDYVRANQTKYNDFAAAHLRERLIAHINARIAAPKPPSQGEPSAAPGEAEEVTCPECKGTGGVHKAGDCSDCNGKGYDWEPVESAAPGGGEPGASSDVGYVGFVQGVVYACARIVELFDQPTMAENILTESGVNLMHGCPEDVAFLAAHTPAQQGGGQ